MSTTEKKIPLAKALYIAKRFMDAIEPYTEKMEVAGSVRRRCKEVGDVEIVCVENPFNSLSNLFTKDYPGIVKNGPRMKSFNYPESGIKIELFITTESDYGRILAIRTGSSAFSISKLAVTWNRGGFCGTEHGLRKKKDCIKTKSGKWVIKKDAVDVWEPPPFKTELDFFNFLGIDWIPPTERNWISKFKERNYSV